MIVDFEGPVFKKLSEQIQPEGVVSVDDNCKLLDTKVIRNDTTGGWRMILRVHRNEDNNKPVELRRLSVPRKHHFIGHLDYILPPK